MSTVPIPKPRALALEKRPIPLPRTNIKKENISNNAQATEPQTNTNTLSKRISTTSKQIIEEISDVLQKNLELRKRSFSKKHSKSSIIEERSTEDDKIIQTSPDIFDNIRFESPLTIHFESSAHSSYTEENVLYINKTETKPITEDKYDEEPESFPPPTYSPPPLVDISFYDTPSKKVPSPPSRSPGPTRSVPLLLLPDKPPPTPIRPMPSVKEQSTGFKSIIKKDSRGIPPIAERLKYEAVFPVYPVFTQGNDSGMDSETFERTDCVRPESWNFYDPVTLSGEPAYTNLEKNDKSDNETSFNSELSQIYQNHISDLHRKNEIQLREHSETIQRQRPSKSTIFEFDPLLNQQIETSTQMTTIATNDTKILCDMFDVDLYGTNMYLLANDDQCSISEESETGDEFLNPPTPPLRTDSLGEDFSASTADASKANHTNWYTNEPETTNIPDSKKSNWMIKLNDVLKKVPESARNIRAGLQRDKFLARPSLNPRISFEYSGVLFRISSKSVEDLFGEFHYRWSTLSANGLVFFSDNTCENSKENIHFDTILSIQLAPEKKYKLQTELHCFELSVTTNRTRGYYVYGIASAQECRQWMQRIAEALTNRFPVNIVMNYTRIGWTYLREGITGVWAGAWLVLSKRNLYYALDGVPMCTIDLRKARCVQLQDVDTDCPKTSDMKSPNLVIDCPERTIYLRMWTARETKTWCYTIKNVAFTNGIKITEQQLTKDNVPVVVEKCMNFIYVNGSMSEGIYRRSGSQSSIKELLSQFCTNAWAVSLTTDKYSEHDVANVLKRFFRNLPEPLLTEEKSKFLCQIANAYAENKEKIKMYRAVLDQFPSVIYCTLKKLLGHLYFINTQSSLNKMNAVNLASVWGPTLVYLENSGECEANGTIINLIIQLIELYRDLFIATPEEITREKMMLEVLQRNFHRQGPQHVKASGDLRIWVHLLSKQGESVIITVGPQRLAGDICIELSSKMNLPAYELQLEECVLNENLRRPIHYSERVLDVVLRWGYWDETDRKDNCLIITHMNKYKPFDKPPNSPIVSEELKFADNKTKSFKNFLFKFEQAKLCYYKIVKSNNHIKISEWNIEDIMWYFGFEPRHNPQTKWAITFILRGPTPKRTKDCPYFGYTIGGNDVNMRSKWVSNMIRAEYSNGLAPPLMNLSSV